MMLDRILESKRREVERRRREVPAAEMERRAGDAGPVRDFAAALKKGTGREVHLIAEFKRASPSRGRIRADLDPADVARLYEEAGASALSVLTDGPFFSGSRDDLISARAACSLPVLRKDFVIDEYQVYEARAHGADAVLLIAAALEEGVLRSLLSLSHDLGMGCLVETHDEGELDVAVASGARVVGINNRDLRTFRVALSTFERLRPRVPAGRIVVAESGIHTPADVRRLASAGADALLVGEALVTAEDIAAKTRELLCAT